jgi:glycosyltransferase involved in cell wall biosynthesis
VTSRGVGRRPWIVLREDRRRRWGGDLRRHYLFNGLVERAGAHVIEDRRVAPLSAALHELGGRRWQLWKGRPLVATTEFLTDKQLALVARLGVPAAVDVHDDVILQADALGVPLSADDQAAILATRRANEAFRWLVAPAAPFAQLAGLDADRVIIASNGTDTRTVRPGPWPDAPGVAFVSGAAPRRGIEELIAAMRIVRGRHPDAKLYLWLAATGDASRAYLDELVARLATETWIEIGQAPYEELGAQLGRATALAIPTPAHPYWDSVAPVKVFDYLAAGRPIVTTPRAETAALVSRLDAGVVTAGDDADAMADSISAVLDDANAAKAMGARAREAAEREFDWRVIGERLAADILART